MRRKGLLVASLLLLSPSLCAADGAALRPTHFVRRGAVVCLRRQDLTKIEHATNSLRYFGQLRALVAEGRCRRYAEREKIIEIGAIEQAERHAIISIRTDEKPDIVRWISPHDIRAIKRFSHLR
ncbi:MAG TPA: hypothetical protein VIF40_20620 [Methylosinus sp.]|jgi:hypothetical protein|uniref:hypothetical protein n=1 Tax=Methylosinus sp. TaxID=427 RepID=UPI002F91EE7F